jgi:hypothetical protein
LRTAENAKRCMMWAGVMPGMSVPTMNYGTRRGAVEDALHPIAEVCLGLRYACQAPPGHGRLVQLASGVTHSEVSQRGSKPTPGDLAPPCNGVRSASPWRRRPGETSRVLHGAGHGRPRH